MIVRSTLAANGEVCGLEYYRREADGSPAWDARIDHAEVFPALAAAALVGANLERTPRTKLHAHPVVATIRTSGWGKEL